MDDINETYIYINASNLSTNRLTKGHQTRLEKLGKKSQKKF